MELQGIEPALREIEECRACKRGDWRRCEAETAPAPVRQSKVGIDTGRIVLWQIVRKHRQIGLVQARIQLTRIERSRIRGRGTGRIIGKEPIRDRCVDPDIVGCAQGKRASLAAVGGTVEQIDVAARIDAAGSKVPARGHGDVAVVDAGRWVDEVDLGAQMQGRGWQCRFGI